MLKLLANVTAQVAVAGAPPPQVTTAIWGAEQVPERLAPWSVHWWLE
jgi:hypothetical protein